MLTMHTYLLSLGTSSEWECSLNIVFVICVSTTASRFHICILFRQAHNESDVHYGRADTRDLRRCHCKWGTGRQIEKLNLIRILCADWNRQLNEWLPMVFFLSCRVRQCLMEVKGKANHFGLNVASDFNGVVTMNTIAGRNFILLKPHIALYHDPRSNASSTIPKHCQWAA